MERDKKALENAKDQTKNGIGKAKDSMKKAVDNEIAKTERWQKDEKKKVEDEKVRMINEANSVRDAANNTI